MGGVLSRHGDGAVVLPGVARAAVFGAVGPRLVVPLASSGRRSGPGTHSEGDLRIAGAALKVRSAGWRPARTISGVALRAPRSIPSPPGPTSELVSSCHGYDETTLAGSPHSAGQSGPNTYPPNVSANRSELTIAGVRDVSCKGGSVAHVQIKCPNSGLWASVGIDVDTELWETMRVDRESSICGVCGDDHVWSKREARLVDWSWA